jgi:hypothetical protein
MRWKDTMVLLGARDWLLLGLSRTRGCKFCIRIVLAEKCFSYSFVSLFLKGKEGRHLHGSHLTRENLLSATPPL